MIELTLPKPRGRPLRVLCLAAHCDDIEIGCGGTLLKMLTACACDVTWASFASDAARRRELQGSARRFLRRARETRVITHEFRDAYFPAHYAQIKEAFEALRRAVDPDIIFTHHRGDRHQDHRLVSELTWNAFRRHLIFEYEIPKYEGDLLTPNAYVGLTAAQAERKISVLLSAYPSQRAKPWFTADTFRGLMRLRGIESGLASGWAEGFHVDKLCMA